MAHPAQPFYFDGDFSSPVRISRTPFEYPFQNNGDVTTKTYDAIYVVHINKFTPTAGGTVDPELAGHYLLAETKPELLQGTLATFRRTYGSVPTDQTDYDTINITKPSPSSLGAVDANFYDSGGFYVAPSYIFSGYLFADQRVFGLITSTTSANSGADTRVTWTSHGLAGTETIVIRQSVGWREFTSGQYTVINANTIDLLSVNYGSSASNAAEYYRDYTPGSDTVRCKIVSKFNLNPLSLAVPSPLLNDAEFLSAILATLTGYIDYGVRYMGRWNASAIYQLDTNQIDMADV